jgi:hypothetical protein
MHLTYGMDEKSFTAGTCQRIIADAITMFGLDDREGELTINVPGESYGDALYSFVQGLLRISDVALLARERVASAFLEDFKEFIENSLPSDHYYFEWHEPIHDPKGMYSVDCYLNGSIRPPVAIYALTNDAKVRDATIGLLKFEQMGLNFRSVGIFLDQEEIARDVLARFSDVCEKQFSSLTANKKRIIHYLEALGMNRPGAS